VPTPLRPVFLCFIGLLVLAVAGVPSLVAQAPPEVHRAVDDAGITITCEVFCSQTKLRTANARIRWYPTKAGPEAASLAAAQHILQTTVFPDGFEKNLYVTVTTGPDAAERAPVAAAEAAKRPLRAFQFRVLQVERDRTSEANTPESGIVVEDLEPGMNYAWRVVAGAGAAEAMRSAVVMCQAPVCPADIVREPRPLQQGGRR
jgi:hypothetical protein